MIRQKYFDSVTELLDFFNSDSKKKLISVCLVEYTRAPSSYLTFYSEEL
jgi:hypothetical protein